MILGQLFLAEILTFDGWCINNNCANNHVVILFTQHNYIKHMHMSSFIGIFSVACAVTFLRILSFIVIVEQLQGGTLRPPQDPPRMVPKCAPGCIF